MPLSNWVSRFIRASQAIIAVALLVLVLALMAGTTPSLFGYESFVVYGGSMEPAIRMGDLAVVGPSSPEKLRPGNIITYRDPDHSNLIVTHRIVSISRDESGNLLFQTKGDANKTTDMCLIGKGGVLGKVAYSIPKVGYLVDFSKRTEGKLLLLVIPGLLLGIDYLFNTRRIDERSVTGRAQVTSRVR
jgi:signal peptidase